MEAGHFADMLVLMMRNVFENVLKLSGFMGVVYSISPLLCLVMAAYAVRQIQVSKLFAFLR